MKIYNKSAFAFGVLCAFALPLFALGIIAADWWQWALTIAISCRYLYYGLSKEANKKANTIQQRYKEVSVRLYGKYAYIKVNLPFIFLVSFFSIVLFIRFAFDVIIPVGVVVVFCIILAVSVVYSIGLDRTIKDTIENETDDVQ